MILLVRDFGVDKFDRVWWNLKIDLNIGILVEEIIFFNSLIEILVRVWISLILNLTFLYVCCKIEKLIDLLVDYQIDESELFNRIWKWFDWQIGFNKDNNLLFEFGLDVLSKADFIRFFLRY